MFLYFLAEFPSFSVLQCWKWFPFSVRPSGIVQKMYPNVSTQPKLYSTSLSYCLSKHDQTDFWWLLPCETLRTRNIEGRKAYFIGYMTNRLLLGMNPSSSIVSLCSMSNDQTILLYTSYSGPLPKAVLFDFHSLNEIPKILKPSGFLGRNPEDDRDHFGKKRILGDQSWHS